MKTGTRIWIFAIIIIVMMTNSIALEMQDEVIEDDQVGYSFGESEQSFLDSILSNLFALIPSKPEFARDEVIKLQYRIENKILAGIFFANKDKCNNAKAEIRVRGQSIGRQFNKPLGTLYKPTGGRLKKDSVFEIYIPPEIHKLIPGDYNAQALLRCLDDNRVGRFEAPIILKINNKLISKPKVKAPCDDNDGNVNERCCSSDKLYFEKTGEVLKDCGSLFEHGYCQQNPGLPGGPKEDFICTNAKSFEGCQNIVDKTRRKTCEKEFPKKPDFTITSVSSSVVKGANLIEGQQLPLMVNIRNQGNQRGDFYIDVVTIRDEYASQLFPKSGIFPGPFASLQLADVCDELQSDYASRWKVIGLDPQKTYTFDARERIRDQESGAMLNRLSGNPPRVPNRGSIIQIGGKTLPNWDGPGNYVMAITLSSGTCEQIKSGTAQIYDTRLYKVTVSEKNAGESCTPEKAVAVQRCTSKNFADGYVRPIMQCENGRWKSLFEKADLEKESYTCLGDVDNFKGADAIPVEILKSDPARIGTTEITNAMCVANSDCNEIKGQQVQCVLPKDINKRFPDANIPAQFTEGWFTQISRNLGLCVAGDLIGSFIAPKIPVVGKIPGIRYVGGAVGCVGGFLLDQVVFTHKAEGLNKIGICISGSSQDLPICGPKGCEDLGKGCSKDIDCDEGLICKNGICEIAPKPSEVCGEKFPNSHEEKGQCVCDDGFIPNQDGSKCITEEKGETGGGAGELSITDKTTGFLEEVGKKLLGEKTDKTTAIAVAVGSIVGITLIIGALFRR